MHLRSSKMQYMRSLLHVRVFRSSVCSLSREEFGDRMLLLAPDFSDPCNIFFYLLPFLPMQPGQQLRKHRKHRQHEKSKKQEVSPLQKAKLGKCCNSSLFCSRSFHEGNRTILYHCVNGMLFQRRVTFFAL